ncbi:MAG: protein phosphatase 2C domain-containing protein [Bdellovibrionaceae bacterium]|nr:protein phosphatase 2C domain-containing protein [Pseudobdellovibrionaceae bacterium]
MYHESIMAKGYSKTHVGHKRKNNQDSFLVDEDLQLYAVADGMGGHKGGEIASSISIEAFHSYLKEAVKKDDFTPELYLQLAFQSANTKVFKKSQENDKELLGMGTTLVACMIWKDKAFFANAGDSRAYLFRDSYLWRITEDHSIINNQLKNGLIETEQVSFLVNSNVITRSIGFFPDIQADIFQKDLVAKDQFLLCSDGLNEISDEKICELCKNYAPSVLPQECINNVLDGEGNDNITVVVVTP